MSFPKQQGIVLLISLIVLVALTLAGIALVRSVDTGNVIAGNVAFKQAALQEADRGIELALNDLQDVILIKTSNYSDYYYTTIQAASANGIPTRLTSAARCQSDANATSSSVAAIFNSATSNCVQYMIERLCTSSIDCQTLEYKSLGGTSNDSNIRASIGNYYRVSVRVDGPRNTTAYTQAILLVNG